MNRHQLYNKYKRDQEAKKFYNSKAWEICRTNVLIRDYYLCQECLKNKLIVVYDVVHHIKSRLEYPELALTEDNLICLCHACHNRIENAVETKEKGIKLIEMGANPEII
ncbi:HNH endonuclease [Ornithinibacillus sp. 4-3]|uniref:Putative HNH nuclease YajD n=1 Tax=Ornithinibacillus sp. 4-3 TaxID=3231488 RepID=A0AB39HKH8_9BACI